jgi:integrase
MKLKWTPAILNKLKPHVRGGSSNNYPVGHLFIPGLTIEIGTTGRKFFWFRATYRGKKIPMRLGEFGPMTIAEAEDAAQKYRAMIDRGLDPRSERNRQLEMPTVREFAEEEYIPQAMLSKRTYKNDIAKFRDYINPAIGHLRLTEVEPRDIQKLLGSLKDKLSPATINRIQALLSVFFNLAVSWNKLERSPCQHLKKLKEQNKRERFLTPLEISRIMAESANDSNVFAAGAICALLMTGLRREEVLKSRKENLDIDKGRLYLPHTKSGRSRTVELNDAAIAVFKGLPNIATSPWLFPGKDTDKPLNNPTKAWHRILKAANVEQCRIHDCRHSFASMLVNEGASLYLVQQLLGHASSATTERYAHLSANTLRNTSQLVSNLFPKSN